jgi:hypothetical protein
MFIALLIAGVAGALYYWTVQDRSARNLEAHPMVEPPPVERPVVRVEVVVHTDVEEGELLVDGESYGTASKGEWVLDLPPGLHRLEARSGGNSVTSSLLTVREGIPATVVLAMPEGASLVIDASAESEDAADTKETHRHERGASDREELAAEPVRAPRSERGESKRAALRTSEDSKHAVPRAGEDPARDGARVRESVRERGGEGSRERGAARDAAEPATPATTPTTSTEQVVTPAAPATASPREAGTGSARDR